MRCRAYPVTPVANVTKTTSVTGIASVTTITSVIPVAKLTARVTLASALAGLFVGAALAQAPAWAPADDPWMSEDAMRAAFIGKTLDGHYGNGLSFTETYFAGGQLEYREDKRQAKGQWHFRGHVFCTFYEVSARDLRLNGGCWTAVKMGANCYDFYLAGLAPEPPFEDETRDMADRWSARGWRSEEPSTCSEKPSV